MSKKYIALVAIGGLVLGFILGFDLGKSPAALGGTVYNRLIEFSEGVSVDGTTVIDGSGNWDGAVTAGTNDISGAAATFTGAVSGTTGTFTGAVSGTTGTFTGVMETESSASSNNIIVNGTTVFNSSRNLTVGGTSVLTGNVSASGTIVSTGSISARNDIAGNTIGTATTVISDVGCITLIGNNGSTAYSLYANSASSGNPIHLTAGSCATNFSSW